MKNRYSENNHGPFDIHIQRISNPSAPLHPITIGRLINRLDIEGIIEIKKVGFSKVSIYLQSGQAANSLVDDPRLKENDLVAFIPLFRTSRKGVIRHVPLDLFENQILEGVKNLIKVLVVRRLNRRVVQPNRVFQGHQLNNQLSTEDTYTPPYSVVIIYEGQKLPTYFTLCYVNHPITPYVSKVSICHACYRFGHIKSSCKGSQRCAHCGEKDHLANKEECSTWHNLPICVQTVKGNTGSLTPAVRNYTLLVGTP